MTDIEKLEAKLAKAKQLEKQKEWEDYLNKTEKYFKSIVGKTFIRYYANGRFVIFKVKGYKEQYYADRNGFNGSWHPSRWVELEASQSIHCSVKDSDGRYFRPEVKYNNFKFNKITGRGKNEIDTSKLDLIDYEEEKYTYLPDDVRTFGRISYENGTPSFNRDLSNFSLFLREAPEGMWEEAKKIADENIIKTKLFWDKYEPIVQSL